MKIDQIGDYLALKNKDYQIIHLLPLKGLFIFRHPWKNNHVLLSNRSKKSIKDAIQINTKDLNQIGNRYLVYNDADLTMICLSLLLDPSKAILNSHTFLGDHTLVNLDDSHYIIGASDITDDKLHFVNDRKGSGNILSIEEAPYSDTVFRITNLSLSPLKVQDEQEEAQFMYNGQQNNHQYIYAGKTVEVVFKESTGMYTITDF